MDRNFWNSRYTATETVYGLAPNLYFAEQIRKLSPGKLLLPAEGEGRNALYAASLGWDVHAFDFSVVGQQKALKLAAESNLKIRYDIEDMEVIELPPDSFDAVALIYVHLPEPTRTNFFQKCVRALKPGGTLIIEGFELAQLRNDSGGPKDKGMLYSVDLLKTRFAELTIEYLAAEHLILEEGPFHKGPSDVVRMVAKKVL